MQHRSRLHIRPPPINLRQVHLIQSETLAEHELEAGEIGENITTAGIDLLALGSGTKLHFAPDAAYAEGDDHPVLVVTGLRNPCPQIDKHRKGLQEVLLVRDEQRKIVGRKAGIMSTVEVGGVVRPGMRIIAETPVVFKLLECV